MASRNLVARTLPPLELKSKRCSFSHQSQLGKGQNASYGYLLKSVSTSSRASVSFLSMFDHSLTLFGRNYHEIRDDSKIFVGGIWDE